MTAIEKHFVNSPGHTLQVAGRAQRLLSRIDIQPGWRYLDVGCGVGAMACAIAKTRGSVMYATRLRFHDAEFHIVASSMATHQIPVWARAFSEMVRVLRPGGYLIYADLMFPSWLASAGRLQA